jgi:hypothetical protein
MHFLFPPGCDLGRGVDLNYFTIVSVRINNSSVSCVPISAPYTARFSVPFGENRRSELIIQRRECALKRLSGQPQMRHH